MSPKEQIEGQSATQTLEVSAFENLLKQEFKPKNDANMESVQSAVQVLAREALKNAQTFSDDAISYIEGLIAKLDEEMSAQMNEIIHHDDFKKLEGAWRGLYHLVSNTETDDMLKIKVMNISKKEVSKCLKRYKGVKWDQSPLFKKIYENEFGMPGGHPYGVLIGDYEFDHTHTDVELLSNIAKISSAAHCPFISAAGPSLLGMDSWQELSDPRDLAKKFSATEYAAWRKLRDSDDSRYLGLTMPRFLARIPYGSKTEPVESFAFEEDTTTSDHNNYVWANSAYAMGTNITRAFKEYGWCARIRGPESGGMVEDLPVHMFPTDDGGVDAKCPTEIGITDRREAELAKMGLMPLSHWKNTDHAVFVGAQSLNKPVVYDDDDATANANLSARLPYMFATCRFAHFLKCIVRDKIGSFKEREDMERWLNKWIMKYVADGGSGEEMRAKYPLSGAEVKVQEDPENPGYYRSQFYLRPHYQLEGLTVSLRLVSRLPSEKGS